MLVKKVFLLAAISIMVVGLILVQRPPVADACTPPPSGVHPTYSIAERFEQAQVVLQATVISTTEATGSPYDQIATIQVSHYFKGNGPDTLEVNNFADMALCLSVLPAVGGEYIFFVDIFGDIWRANYGGVADAYVTASTNNVQQAYAAQSGATPTPLSIVTADPTALPPIDLIEPPQPTPLSEVLATLMALCATALMGVGSMVFMVQRRA